MPHAHGRWTVALVDAVPFHALVMHGSAVWPSEGRVRMFGAWWTVGYDTALLAMESQAVIGLRLAKLAAGGTAAQAEAQRMVSEKLVAAGEAAMLVATGGTAETVIAGYRRKVQANQRRLSRAC